MKEAARTAFLEFTTRFEGRIPKMYLDIRGLVTIGVGNLIDPIETAMRLPFMHPGNYPARVDEIAAEWHMVKNHQVHANKGAGYFSRITSLYLTDEGIDQLVFSKLDEMWTILSTRFADLESWPADAQLGLISMAWAAGPQFRAPHFIEACKAKDFARAASECRFNDVSNPGLRPRNDANEVLFCNAAEVLASGLNPDELYYPAVVLPKVTIEAAPPVDDLAPVASLEEPYEDPEQSEPKATPEAEQAPPRGKRRRG